VDDGHPTNEPITEAERGNLGAERHDGDDSTAAVDRDHSGELGGASQAAATGSREHEDPRRSTGARLLVVTAEPVDAGVLKAALGDDAADAEVMVVAPALQKSSLRFWMSDADDAIARAQDVQGESVKRLEEEGVDAAGDTGESEPLVAIQDALATFDADRILVVGHDEDEHDSHEEDLAAADLERRFGIPAERVAISR